MKSNIKVLMGMTKYMDVVLALAIIAVLFILIIPLPTWILDILLTFNITFGLLILLVTIYVDNALELSSFPSLLLFATLFRLSLNVASTRLILLNADAGRVIEAFGSFVVGGNYIVGIVIFLILIIIQFVVITKGATRIAEVAARFTLDAMPGKQMSIDADLNAGLIDDDEARERRRNISREADFYGAMDGASKFVRGDAIAGVIITMVNIIGGFIIGMLQRNMSFAQSLQVYTLLTVGDGLVAQIPSLIISTAAGIIVTRAAGQSNLGQELSLQILSRARAVGLSSAMLFIFGLVPGLPSIPFFALSALTGGFAFYIKVKSDKETRLDEEAAIHEEPEKEEDKQSKFLEVEPMEIEIGYALISLVDSSQGGDLLNRITMIRRQCAQDLGLVAPPIRIRDNMQLKPNEYVIKIKSIEVARGEIFLGSFLAMNPGTATEELTGRKTREPAFGLPATWVNAQMKEDAEAKGYTVVDPVSVFSTHLSELIKSHAYELLSRQDTKDILDSVKEKYPTVIEELVPNMMTVGGVHRILQALLKERISIKDMVSILEALGDAAAVTKDVETLVEHVRTALARQISKQYANREGTILAVTVSPQLESLLRSMIQTTEHGQSLLIEPSLAQKILSVISKEMEKIIRLGEQPVIVCSPVIRIHFKRLCERLLPQIVVLSYSEIATQIKLKSLGVINVEQEYVQAEG